MLPHRELCRRLASKVRPEAVVVVLQQVVEQEGDVVGHVAAVLPIVDATLDVAVDALHRLGCRRHHYAFGRLTSGQRGSSMHAEYKLVTLPVTSSAQIHGFTEQRIEEKLECENGVPRRQVQKDDGGDEDGPHARRVAGLGPGGH